MSVNKINVTVFPSESVLSYKDNFAVISMWEIFGDPEEKLSKLYYPLPPLHHLLQKKKKQKKTKKKKHTS